MAIAFYIPDQEKLVAKAKEQEQQILRMRANQWKLMAIVMLEVLRQYVAAHQGQNGQKRTQQASAGETADMEQRRNQKNAKYL